MRNKKPINPKIKQSIFSYFTKKERINAVALKYVD
jgi:hypothetical protein